MHDQAVDWIREYHDVGFRDFIKSEIDASEKFGRTMTATKLTRSADFPVEDSDYVRFYKAYDFTIHTIVEDFFGSYTLISIIRDSLSSREIMVRMAKLATISVLCGDASDVERYGYLT